MSERPLSSFKHDKDDPTSEISVTGQFNTLESDVVRSSATSIGLGASIEDLVCHSSTETFTP